MSYITQALQEELDRPEYKDDSIRIAAVAYEHSIVLTLKQAEKVWQIYSDSMAAGWMLLPKTDEELWEIIG